MGSVSIPVQLNLYCVEEQQNFDLIPSAGTQFAGKSMALHLHCSDAVQRPFGTGPASLPAVGSARDSTQPDLEEFS